MQVLTLSLFFPFNWARYPWHELNNVAALANIYLLQFNDLPCLQYAASCTRSSSSRAMRINEHLACPRLKYWQNVVNGVLINASCAARGQQAKLIKCSLQCDQSHSTASTSGAACSDSRFPLRPISLSLTLYLSVSRAELTSCGGCRSRCVPSLINFCILMIFEPRCDRQPAPEPKPNSTQHTEHRAQCTVS